MSTRTVDAPSQQVPFFGTPVGFTQTVRMRRVRFAVGKAHAEWATAWYAQMRDLAKQGRVMGEFTTDLRSFVDSYGGYVPMPDDEIHDGWVALCVDLWRAFEDAGLVRIDGDVEDVSAGFRVRVVDFAETNRRRPRVEARTEEEAAADRRAKAAERQRRKRERERAAQDASEGVTPVTLCHADVTPCHENVTCDRRDEKRDTHPSFAGNVTPVTPTFKDNTIRKRDRHGGAGGGNARDPHPSTMVDATDERSFVDRVAAKLAGFVNGDAQLVAEGLLFRARAPHPRSHRAYPLSQWETAVDLFADRVRRGNVPDGDPMGYLIGMVPTAAAVEIRAEAIGTAPPPPSAGWKQRRVDTVGSAFSAEELAALDRPDIDLDEPAGAA